MDHLDDCYQRFASADPDLLAALGADDPATRAQLSRLLRLTTFDVLRGHEGPLVHVLAEMPEMHHRLRATWSRQDARATARVFAHVAQARLHADRTTGPMGAVANPLRDRELAAA